jgi:hypothetical protein
MVLKLLFRFILKLFFNINQIHQLFNEHKKLIFAHNSKMEMTSLNYVLQQFLIYSVIL